MIEIVIAFLEIFVLWLDLLKLINSIGWFYDIALIDSIWTKLYVFELIGLNFDSLCIYWFNE